MNAQPSQLAERILQTLRQYAATHKECPSWRELADLAGVSLETLSQHLKVLRALELVKWEEGKNRTLQPATGDWRPQPVVVLDRIEIKGRINAGVPIEHTHAPPASYAWPPEGATAYFVMPDNSLAPMGIRKGDVILVRRQADVADGELAVVRLPSRKQEMPDVLTVRRVYHLQGASGRRYLRLESVNPLYPTIELEAQRVVIEGKPMCMQRWLEG